MKVLIEYIKTGKYKDQAWESLTLRTKGEVHAVTPSYAAQLIQQKKARLCKDDNGDIVIDA